MKTIGIDSMKEIKINDQYSLYYRKTNHFYLVELHDFHNLTMYRDYIDSQEFQEMRNNPEWYI